jgi:hypothetical protein
MKKSHLYFIRNPFTGLIKIGISRNVDARLYDLECSSGVPLELLRVIDAGVDHEQPLHQAFGDCRALGEWFFPCEDLHQLIAGTIEVAEVLSRRAHIIAAANAAKLERMSIEAKARDEDMKRRKKLAATKKRIEREIVAEREKAQEKANARSRARANGRKATLKAELERVREAGRLGIRPLTPEDISARRAAFREAQNTRNRAFAGVKA